VASNICLVRSSSPIILWTVFQILQNQIPIVHLSSMEPQHPRKSHTLGQHWLRESRIWRLTRRITVKLKARKFTSLEIKKANCEKVIILNYLAPGFWSLDKGAARFNYCIPQECWLVDICLNRLKALMAIKGSNSEMNLQDKWFLHR
jgi:hypothetical protein